MAPLFLRLILWKSPPRSISIFVILDFFTNVLVVSFVLIYSEAELRVWWIQQKRSIILVLTLAKNENFKFSGDEFFMMSISKIMVPLWSPGFLLHVVTFAIVLVTYVKHLTLMSAVFHFCSELDATSYWFWPHYTLHSLHCCC